MNDTDPLVEAVAIAIRNRLGLAAPVSMIRQAARDAVEVARKQISTDIEDYCMSGQYTDPDPHPCDACQESARIALGVET